MNAIAFIKKHALAGIALALTIGFSSYRTIEKLNADVYTFVNVDNQSEFTGTRQDAMNLWGCPEESGDICARAYEEGHAGDEDYRRTADDIFKP